MRAKKAGSAPSLGRNKWTPYLYLSPALISIAILSIFPMIFTLALSFTDASLYTFKNGFHSAGLSNYVEMFTGGLSKVFFPVAGWTLLYAAISVAIQYAVGMFVAILLDNPNMRESRLYRALLVIPWAIPGTLATLAWQGQFNGSYGTINRMLAMFHMAPIYWLQGPNLAKVAVIIVNLWTGFPFFMTLCLGSLQSIPYELYEVAEIDGASNWHKFWRVTFPLLLRFTAPLLVGSFAFNFNNFGTAFLLTGGGPGRPGPFQAGYTDILVSVSYKLTAQLNRYGLAAAVSTILFLIVAGLSLVNMRITGGFKEEED
ncbi:MAG: carbohydrate ABC transporter permease [Mycobacterium leprae]